jgi:predicted metal-dependent hydrolase
VKNKHTLSDAQKEQLKKTIHQLRLWFQKVLPEASIRSYHEYRFPKPNRDDWIMWVDEKKGEVNFNSYVIAKCSFEYFELIVIHECFHLFVQDLPNKADARLVKHGFGEAIMKLLDVEADYFAARFLKEHRRATLIDILKLYAEGSHVFGDPRVLTPKLERFIGSVLSITNLYFKNPNHTKVREVDLYLPTIVGVHTDEMLNTVISRNSHFLISRIYANAQDFSELMRAYTNVGNLTTYGYVELLLRFSEKALSCDAPPKVRQQLNNLSKR